jgi:2-hydroxy-6-oxonona-2,4-dienedioate hydrolase
MTQTQTGFAPINGAQLYYEVAGSGKTLVFTHAGVTDNRLWDDQFDFYAQNYKVIRYDMRGFGKSEPVEGEFSLSEDLLGLMKHLNVDKATLIGCSMGGGASMDVALNQPQMVEGLVMVCSAPNGLWLDVEFNPKEADAEAAFKAQDWEKVLEFHAQIWFDGMGRTPEQVNPVLREKFKTMDRIVIANEAKGIGKHKPGMKPPAAERLSELNMPVLAIVGVYDEPYIHAAGDHMATHIKNARKVMIDNAAHVPSLEQPAEFNKVLSEFLTGVK